jgi:hypothetical protein
MNLTRAMMDIYRGDANDVTLMAVNLADSTGSELKFEWNTIGVAPKSFTVKLDGKTLLENTNVLTCSIPRNEIKPGDHTFSVEANGAGTRYELSKFQYDMVSAKLMPLIVDKTFRISK